jgi:hypothetical protein
MIKALEENSFDSIIKRYCNIDDIPKIMKIRGRPKLLILLSLTHLQFTR